MLNRFKGLPKQFLWRLTLVNGLIVSSFIAISSWAIYNTACVLAEGMLPMNASQQSQFNATLFQYLWIFSVITIVTGSIVHFYLTRKMIHPLRELIESTKKMKRGEYPGPLEVNNKDETGQLIGHFNDLVKQLKINQQHKDKLVTDISHEFRTPLSNLNGYLYALQKGVVTGDEKLYQALHDEAKRLTNMVEQLEHLKEWDYVSNQVLFEKDRVEIVRLIEQSVDMCHWSLEKAGIVVNVELESGVVVINREAVLQVMSNLLENAIRYNIGSSAITVRGDVSNKKYKVSVSGKGTAIPEADHHKIFDRFYRVDGSRNRSTGGVGLGLAISKEIVQSHGGDIWLSSNGNDHTFAFTLPKEE
ncbi:ATP-binding protein [Aquibacillus koreensis]|uniref:histidine kinase n=1 Tax=Aquibacillus koreensis TaxID=279446 RepID=A0A9X3WNK9_9BACI|nr:ATP-binding protein [Aquibacillus koreensis]MCT2536768.1 ATP-binding protein [Aquibacillus koreensis]MDC3421476.1 ATP-binding protein [Aquibacillus koreensis]